VCERGPLAGGWRSFSASLHSRPGEADLLVRELARSAADRRQLLEQVMAAED
jgi:hypothetical protein